MNAEKCRILLSVINNNSITKTADKLGYTTSGISKVVSSLEEEAGFQLLIRSKDGIRPTADCEVLLPLFRELVSTINKIDQTVAGIKGIEIGTINVGSSYNIYYRWLTEKIAEYFVDHPGIKVRAYSEVSAKLKERLDNHQIDVCIMSKRDGDFKWEHLKWDQLVVLVNKNHRFVSRGNFPLKSLATEPYIQIYPGSETDNSLMLNANHIMPNIQFECANAVSAVPIVEAGLGVCIVNELIADGIKGDVVALPIFPQQMVDIGIATTSAEAASPLVNSFINHLQNKTHEIL